MNNEVTVYTINHCPYCVSAKSLLTENGIPFNEVLVTDSDDEIRNLLQRKSGMRTFPQIFVGEALLGGFSELNTVYHQRGLNHLTTQGV